MRRALPVFALLLSLLCAGCASMPATDAVRAAGAIPTRLIPAPAAPPQAQRRLVVVLPGRADDLAALGRSGVAEAIQRVWPDADVLFAELRLPDYRRGDVPERLDAQVMQPARARGYREIWLGGASLGGLGTLLYDRRHPGETTGLLLLAPYLGDGAIPKSVAAAGGLTDWTPPAGEPGDADDWQRDLWRHLQAIARDPAAARRVWLAYGRRDRLRDTIALFAPVLPADHVLTPEGGHAWRTWTPAMETLLRRIDASREATPAR